MLYHTTITMDSSSAVNRVCTSYTTALHGIWIYHQKYIHALINTQCMRTRSNYSTYLCACLSVPSSLLLNGAYTSKWTCFSPVFLDFQLTHLSKMPSFQRKGIFHGYFVLSNRRGSVYYLWFSCHVERARSSEHELHV